MVSPEFSVLCRRLAEFRGALALVGSAKNAGKTTALNFLLRQFPTPPAGVTSIGYDGERIDTVERHAKPEIRVAAGTLFATAAGCLPRCEGSWTVLENSGVETALGEVALARAEAGCRLELAGPSELSGLIRVSDRMRVLGAKRVLIDGAFDRVAAAAIQLSDALLLAVGCAGKSTVEDAAQDARCAVARFQLPRQSEGGAGSALEMNSLTDDQLPGLEGRTVLLPDSSRCLIEPASWRWIDSGRVRVFVRRRAELVAVFTNPFRPHRPPLDAERFLARVRELCENVPVFDLKLEGALHREGAEDTRRGRV